MHIDQVPHSTEIRIGEKVPPDIALQTFPPLVAEKVPQVRTYKYFLTKNQIVVVSPQNIIADIINSFNPRRNPSLVNQRRILPAAETKLV